MKKVVYAILLLTVLCSCASKSEINESIKTPRVLYKSVLNVIELDQTLKDIEVSITNGQISKGANNTFEVLVDTSYTTTLIIKQKNKVNKIEFRVKRMPKPELKFWSSGTHDLNNITLEEFKNFRSAVPILQDFSVDCIFNMVKVTVIRIRDGEKKVYEFKNLGSDNIRRLTADAKKGDTYIFKDIQIEIQQTRKIIPGQELTLYLQ